MVTVDPSTVTVVPPPPNTRVAAQIERTAIPRTTIPQNFII